MGRWGASGFCLWSAVLAACKEIMEGGYRWVANVNHPLSAGLLGCRENTEGEYSGLEHEVVPDVVESLKVITEVRCCIVYCATCRLLLWNTVELDIRLLVGTVLMCQVSCHGARQIRLV